MSIVTGKRKVQVAIDRAAFPTADDEYTPRQRRRIDAQLKRASKGPFHGPFRNRREVTAFLNLPAKPKPKRDNERRADNASQ